MFEIVGQTLVERKGRQGNRCANEVRNWGGAIVVDVRLMDRGEATHRQKLSGILWTTAW